MTKSSPNYSIKLEEFDKKSSPTGLFWRYCRWRVHFFWHRMVVLAGVGFALSFLLTVELGIALYLLVSVADIADSAVLKRAMKYWAQPERFLEFRKLAVILAAFQSGSIALSVVIAWLYGGPPAHFFALVMITSTAIDAGMSVYYFRLISRLKQTLFITAMLTLFVVDYTLNLTPHAILIVDLGAATILAYVISRLLNYLYNFQGYNRVAMRKVILAEQDTQHSNRKLKAQRSEARKLALVAEKVNDSIIISTPDGEITWVNATFTSMTGFSPEEAVGQIVGTLLDGPWTSKAALKQIANVSKTLKPARVEIENKTKAGARIWIESSITPIFDKHGKHVLNIGVERDISIAQKVARDLATAKQTAEKALKIKTEFLATMSHEIRTPMNGIVGMSDLLSRTDLSPDQLQYVKTITDSGAALLSIIDDILNFSKLEAGKLELAKSPFSLSDILRSIHNLLEPTARQKGLKLHVSPGHEKMPYFLGDKGRIRQIIVNLVGNAIKFTNEGQVSITVSWAAKGKTGLLSIGVKDSGVGIPPDKLAQIFEAFTQVDGKSTRSADGTGLGLSISKQLAHQMSGDITVESSEGIGSNFTFRAELPIASADSPGSNAKQNTPTCLPKALRVLVAEDNLTNQLIIRKMLDTQSAAIRIAENGADVLEMYKEKWADVVLMDISMPVVGGLEATKNIRAFEESNNLKQTPIIALTANAYDSDRKNCFAVGMNGFVTKPIILNTLIEEIGRALNGKA
ncbi:MAG TPA: response regulator [Rhodobacteraceae bacterium]|nr:response regulator [Paracoccaceae bacterium]